MNKYNNQYYIAQTCFTPTQIHIVADRKTENRDYTFTQLNFGETPLFFKNGFEEKDRRTGGKRVLTDVLMDGASMMVVDAIRDELKKYNIDYMQLYPAVYIDDNQIWHENYWYLNFYRNIDCWDRKYSIYEKFDDDDFDDDDDDNAIVDKYYLDVSILDAIPEEKRLLFRMGGASNAYIFVHQRIADFLIKNKHTGIRLFKVADFEEGDQHDG